MRPLLVVLASVVLCTGCIPEEFLDPTWKQPETQIVHTNPFHSPGPVKIARPKMSYQQTDKTLAIRVANVGQKLMRANPEIAMKPLFITHGSPELEIFHTAHNMGPIPPNLRKKAPTDGRSIYITEGLAKRCRTDGQLAVLLAIELAEMVVEREVLANPKMRSTEEPLPIDLPIGAGVQSTGAEEIRLAELARYEKNRRPKNQPLPLPDPEKLARRYLQKAGFAAEEYDGIKSLRDEAERTYQLEKQFRKVTNPSAPSPVSRKPKTKPGNNLVRPLTPASTNSHWTTEPARPANESNTATPSPLNGNPNWKLERK